MLDIEYSVIKNDVIKSFDCTPTDSSFWFDSINLGMIQCKYHRVTGYDLQIKLYFYIFFLSKQ